MTRHRIALPEGTRPIVSPAIARTRFLEDFYANLPSGEKVTGKFYDVAKKIGITLKVQNTPPFSYLELNSPIYGRYMTGRVFSRRYTALFTATSKMPGPSFAIPAGPPSFGGTCQASAMGDDVAASRKILETAADMKIEPNRVADSGPLVAGVRQSYYGDNSFICRSCYALGHNYIYPSKQLNDMTHLAWCRQELAAGGPERLGKALALAIQHIDMYRQAGFQPFFRIHDAGDFESPEYLEAWVICCALMKHMRFWAPSRQWIFKKWADLYRSAEKRVRDAGGWLVIRPSALRACEPAPAISGLTAGSGVGANTSEPCIWVCPVYNQIVMKLQPDGTVKAEEAVSCLEAQCTLCWDINTTVSYGLH